ncbi:MAG: hypothetical protein HUU57_12285 [Bdellovibrio sp.]|nr:hypothetical protein [Bdellovibrio sp.]
MKFIIVTLLTFVMSFAYAQNHDHHAGHSKKIEKIVSSNKQFKPTDDLKVRMEKILNHMKELSKKKEDLKSVKEYGNKLTDTVNDIFKTCKLEPDADAAIHPTLGLILEGAEDFKIGKYESGHKKIHKALLDYEKLFKHEGWKP